MKKFMYLAVLAGVALVGCTKNERTTELIDSQKEISFTTPVLATTTKADELKGTKFPDDKDFSVFAYYTEGNFSSVNTTLATYMDNVKVVNGTYDNSTPGTFGGWHAETPYYWPKNTNSRLTFDAYYPTALSFASTAADGLKLTDYEAPYTYATQNDVMYATRAFDKTFSNQENDGNADYDGVDIQFNHAMSVVKIMVKAKDASAAAAIKVKSVTLKEIAQKGTFSQTYATNGTGAVTSGWDVTYTAPLASYAATDPAADYGTSTEIMATLTGTQYGNNMIVLPQSFATGGAVNAEIEVVYYIKNGGSDPSVPAVEQKYSFKLNDAGHKDADTSAQITAWEMSKRYTYTITFAVDEIFLAPAITDWTDVNVTVPTI
ncbi:MAG: fimbrillin family protein [Candidatus Cryptobacteroides sp.]